MAAAAALGADVIVEPVTEGVSTYVYRIRRGLDVFYLRILPEDGATFAPEAEAHAILRRQGVRVPEVVFCEDLNPLTDRSIMITTEIKGVAIGHGGAESELPDILRAAGRDIAILNSVPVHGFGWIRRDAPADRRLRADATTEREFMLADFHHALFALDGTLLSSGQAEAIRDVVAAKASLLAAGQACLAHGDLDATHIYANNGQYTGLIDLGEMRGTGPYYDLGHVRFHDGDMLPTRMLPYLLEGYQEITPLPPDADQRIALASLLIGTQFLARTQTRLVDQVLLHGVATIEREVAILCK
jgi:aminoglycoside phosphotransferase (APT) family kinase protein